MHRDRERHLPFARITLAAALLAGAMGAGSVRAEEGAGCTVSTSPTMLTVTAGAAQTRQIDLAAGERLDFTATADQGAAVTIALISGAGAPRTLFAGDTPAATSFRRAIMLVLSSMASPTATGTSPFTKKSMRCGMPSSSTWNALSGRS